MKRRPPLGAKLLLMVPAEHTGGAKVGGYGRERPVFWLHEQASAGSGRHYAFSARNRRRVDAFYEAALKAGGRDNGPPGLRPHYHDNYYGAFVLDPEATTSRRSVTPRSEGEGSRRSLARDELHPAIARASFFARVARGRRGVTDAPRLQALRGD